MPSALTLNPLRSLSGSASAARQERPSQIADASRTARIALIGAPSVPDPLNLDLPSFDGELERVIAAGATDLVVDLSEAGPVGSLALNALLRARQQLGKRGQIALIMPPKLRRFCGAVGLDRRFLLADDHSQALRLLRLETVAAASEPDVPRAPRRPDSASDNGGKRAA